MWHKLVTITFHFETHIFIVIKCTVSIYCFNILDYEQTLKQFGIVKTVYHANAAYNRTFFIPPLSERQCLYEALNYCLFLDQWPRRICTMIRFNSQCYERYLRLVYEIDRISTCAIRTIIHPKLVVTVYKTDLTDIEMFTCLVSYDLSVAVLMFSYINLFVLHHELH